MDVPRLQARRGQLWRQFENRPLFIVGTPRRRHTEQRAGGVYHQCAERLGAIRAIGLRTEFVQRFEFATRQFEGGTGADSLIACPPNWSVP
jgi:hypothetical protein